MSTSWCLALFVALCLIPTMTSGNAVRGRNRRRQSTTGQYYWVCPEVVCAAVPDTCQTVEYFVMEFEYSTNDGQRATIRCESCEYCLDAPVSSDAGRRARRSVDHPRRQNCSSITCPEVPQNCADIRQTDSSLGGVYCKKCPACYDNTFINLT